MADTNEERMCEGITADNVTGMHPAVLEVEKIDRTRGGHDDDFDWGGGSTAGLVFQNGSLQSINMTVTSSITVGSVTFAACSL